jgi:DNA-binding NtrC family response regulator
VVRSLTVLLVDRDPSYVDAMSRLLARVGHRVIGCHDATAARQQLVHTRVDVVVTEWQHGDDACGELIKELRIVRPEVRIVILSGDLDHVPGELRVSKLQKPVAALELLSAIKGDDELRL